METKKIKRVKETAKVFRAPRNSRLTGTSCFRCKGLIMYDLHKHEPMFDHFCNEVPLVVDFAQVQTRSVKNGRQ